PRILSVAVFSFSFAYLLSFLFEGQVLYGLLNHVNIPADTYILCAVIAQFLGLFTCGFFIHTQKAAKRVLWGGLLICLFVTIPFFFQPTVLWILGIIIAAYASGCAVAAWGWFLKTYTPQNQRIKTCADGLICSNLLMIAVNMAAIHISPFMGLAFAVLCLVLGITFAFALPIDGDCVRTEEIKGSQYGNVWRPLLLLCLFVFVITINSGLMYQVMNPAFAHLTDLTSWYWAVPYIIALVVMRSLPSKVHRSKILYLGMAMIIASFISFMLLGRDETDYFVANTLMLGACGIFDLFWWSILGEMLDYTDNATHVFGIGLSANVAGVLCGGMVGMAVTSIRLSDAEVAVIALTVVCITLVMLPPLNRQLVLLLKNHVYLAIYERMTELQQTTSVNCIQTLDPLTVREKEVLQLILSGKPNREIATELSISESTVKTHVRNIFSKYDVQSRAELISLLLKNQTG
ncbi:MAG: helix-turn-helix transcriptional regulator, partial [Eubacteriales bacterium]|nr:helix-turn-helix transcriptional regulator [Eubacteriales bacterium]